MCAVGGKVIQRQTSKVPTYNNIETGQTNETCRKSGAASYAP